MSDGYEVFKSEMKNYTFSGMGHNSGTLQFSQEDLVEQFVETHANNLRYVNEWGHWLEWDGMVWKKDNTQKVTYLVREICRDIAMLNPKEVKSIRSKATVEAIEKLAQTDRIFAVTSDAWDANKFTLNTSEGFVDLKTGKLFPHNSIELCTKITAIAPMGDCPLWKKFLGKITNDNAEFISYLQRVAGYCLTGSTNEHALFFLYGTGANGKSVFLNTIHGIMNDYAVTAPMGAFTANRNEGHSTDLAMLQGARIALVQETESGQRWAEAKIKDITGGTPITARYMRQDNFTFIPQFKILMAGNHKPSLANVDEAIRRRLHLIPFTITIPSEERDLKLAEKLKAEWSGILSWMVQGCLEWQSIGLKPPPSVISATNEYFDEEDTLHRFLEDECQKSRDGLIETREMFVKFRDWCNATGESFGTEKSFVQKLKSKKFEMGKHPQSRRSCVKGLVLQRGEIPFEARAEEIPGV